MDDTKKPVPVPTWAWFAMAALMILMGVFSFRTGVHDFFNGIAHARSNRLITRADSPIGFWLYNILHLLIGVFGLLFALFCVWGGNKQRKDPSSPIGFKKDA